MTLIIAHRGASRDEPENTLAAFRKARAVGADGVELDVRRSADDVLVVHHDAALADGRAVRSVPHRELPEHVPTLAEAIGACDGMFVNIEVKNDPSEVDFDPARWVVHRLAAELAPLGEARRWLVSSFDLDSVDLARLLMPASRTAWLVMRCTENRIARAAAHGHDAIHPSVKDLSEPMIRHAHRSGLAVNTWTCNEPDRMRELMGWGVDGICTDVPDVALAARGV